MDTQWDDNRIRATVKARSNPSPVTGLQEVGFVAQLHDHGPAGERFAKPVLLFDSESGHGTAGVFGDERSAQAFADRRLEAELRCQREIEAERHRRRDALSERQRDLWAEEKRQKEIAAEARKAATDADKQARKLAEEADEPEIAISCNPSEDGWSLWVAPCWTDGTQDGDPRQLAIAGTGMLGPRKVATSEPKRRGLDPAEALVAFDKPKRKGKRPPPRTSHVPDTKGQPIGIGTEVTFHGGSGRVTAIRGEGDEVMLEIEDETGMPCDILPDDVTRVEDDQPGDWPDPEAA